MRSIDAVARHSERTFVPMWHRLYYLVTWTTRDRSRLIDAGLATFLCPYFRGVARQERAHALEIGMVTTHVHALVRTHPTTDLTRLVQRLKGGNSALAGKGNYSTTGVRLKWAKGYSIVTLGARALMAAREYLRTQPARHPAEAIVGWKGDDPEYEAASEEQWSGPDRRIIR